MQTRYALITGATSGIGQATARLFASQKINLIICGRRLDRLKELQQELSSLVDVTTLSFDISNRKEVDAAFETIQDQIGRVDVLLNNAGNAHGLATIEEGSLDDFDKMIDINVKGLLYVSKKVIPHMVQKKSGHIINIGSIAGKEVYLKGNVYCASKFAVDALSGAMRLDLNQYGIKVSNIAPGLVETEFSLVRFKGDTHKAHQTYQGYSPLKPEDIAELIFFVVSRPKHVNLADCLILPLAQASASLIKKS